MGNGSGTDGQKAGLGLFGGGTLVFLESHLGDFTHTISFSGRRRTVRSTMAYSARCVFSWSDLSAEQSLDGFPMLLEIRRSHVLDVVTSSLHEIVWLTNGGGLLICLAFPSLSDVAHSIEKRAAPRLIPISKAAYESSKEKLLMIA